jgi:hypothetical protein
MKIEMEAYVEAYTDANPDYNAIQTAILNSAEIKWFWCIPWASTVAAWDAQRRRTTGSLG